MGIKNSLIQYGKRQSFQPNLLSLFINPFFFIRRGLYRGIKKNATSLSGRLIDFGCGRKPYRNLFQVDEYIGIDIEVSGHNHEESEVDVFYDGKTVPFDDNNFDALFCSEVIEHVFNVDEVLPEMHRVLKPGAKALFTIPLAWGEHEQPFDFARYTSFGIKSILERHGFEIIQIDKSNHFAEALMQLWTAYIFTLIKSENRILNSLLTLIFISPFNFIGFLLSPIFPKSYDYYNNLIILAQKK